MNNYKYKRINHFTQFINQHDKNYIQKNINPILTSNNIIDTVKEYLIMQKMSVNSDNVKIALKQLKLNKYYEYVPWIVTSINNTFDDIPEYSVELKETLCDMFSKFEKAYQKEYEGQQKCFPSYAYILYKFLEVLNKNEYMEYIRLPVIPYRMMIHDMMWNKVTKDIDW